MKKNKKQPKKTEENKKENAARPETRTRPDETKTSEETNEKKETEEQESLEENVEESFDSFTDFSEFMSSPISPVLSSQTTERTENLQETGREREKKEEKTETQEVYETGYEKTVYEKREVTPDRQIVNGMRRTGIILEHADLSNIKPRAIKPEIPEMQEERESHDKYVVMEAERQEEERGLPFEQKRKYRGIRG